MRPNNENKLIEAMFLIMNIQKNLIDKYYLKIPGRFYENTFFSAIK